MKKREKSENLKNQTYFEKKKKYFSPKLSVIGEARHMTKDNFGGPPSDPAAQ